MDRLQFEDAAFEVKSWINKACADCPDGTQLDRYLAELEMKMQLIAEDVEVSLQASSADVVKQVTAANGELTRLHGDLLGIGDTVSVLATQVKHDERSCAQAVAGLWQLDSVKERMQASCTTIKEASELTTLCKNMEEVSMSGDVARMARDLATMRRSLAALGQVPQFLRAAEQLTLLEGRFRELVEPALADAMAKHNVEAMRQHWQQLVNIDKADLAQELYVRQVNTRVHAIFSQHSSQTGGLLAWLPAWHKSLLAYVTSESGFLSSVLPEQHTVLLLQALSVALKGCTGPMLEALPSVQSPPGPLLDTLVSSLHLTARICAAFRDVFPGVHAQVMSSLTHPLLQPFEGFVGDYARLEASVLSSQMASISMGAGGTRDLDVEVEALAAAPAAALAHLTSALARCHAFTGSLQLPALVPALDASLLAFLKRFSASVSALAAHHSPDSATTDPLSRSAAPLAVDDVEAIEATTKLLRLPLVLVDLQKVQTEVEGDVRARCAQLCHFAAAARTGDADAAARAARTFVPEGVVDIVLWRATGEREWPQLQALQERLASVVLAGAHAQLGALQSTVDTLLLRRLTLPVAHALKEMDGLADTWVAEGAGDAAGGFGAYANTYATSIGEYLIMLPQQLEVLVPQDADEHADTLASQWLDKTATAVADLVADRVIAIPRLGHKGAVQLATDLEYVCNVIGALGVVLPPSLATASVLCTMPDEDDFKACVASGVADGTLDAHACKVLAKMRGISLDSA